MKLLVWGYNYKNQLGLNMPLTLDGGLGAATVLEITQSPTGSDWADIAQGVNHAIGVKSDGTLWASGYGYYGQLGLGINTSSSVFIQVGTDTDWQKVFAGGSRSFAIKTDGTLWACGDAGSYSLLGLGDNVDKGVFTKIGSSNLWESISVGFNFNLGLMSDGTVWSWGNNGDGYLGLGDKVAKTVPTEITAISNVSKIYAQGYHSHLITDDGKLYGFGANGFYELGITSSTADVLVPTQVGVDTDWIDICAGNFYCMALKSNGELYSCGDNTYGNLGVGDFTARTSLTLATTKTDWARIFVGAQYGYTMSMAIDSSGVLYGWGSNDNDQLQNGDAGVDIHTPIIVGSEYSTWGPIAPGSGMLMLLDLEDDFWTNFRSQTEIHL